MAREHARIWLDINADDEFEALPFDAQGFYTRVILTLSDLSYAGVADWRPRKLTTKAPDLTYERIQAAASALEVNRYCLFDLDTEEVLARSFIRRDELLRNPKFAAAVVKAYAGIASKTLRAAVVTEIRRVREEHPEYTSWTAKDKTTDVGAALASIMAKPGLDAVGYTNQIAPGITNAESVIITNTDSVTIGNAGSVQNGIPIGNGDSVRIPSTYTSTSTPSPLDGGYVSRERHQGDDRDPNAPPSLTCPAHPNGTSIACHACGDARKVHADWRMAQAARERAEARAAAERLRTCPLCDDAGWAIDESGEPVEPARKCVHPIPAASHA